jgi:polyhydroxyalkanoate synthesis regulator phasin
MTTEGRSLPDFNQMLDAWVKAATDAERRWNEYFNQQMATDEFTQAMTRTMEGYAAMQANFARGMEQYLRALNIPTHADLAKLAERVTALEQRIDSLEAREEPPDAPVIGRQPASRQRSGSRRKER